MKYIRTKDHIEELYIDEFTEYGKEYYKNSKIANTIEELCDEFVRVSKSVHDFLVSDDIPTKKFNDTEIYGAIWTDKGLIYVAKMNEKGKLELL